MINAACNGVENGSEDVSVAAGGTPQMENVALPGAHVLDADARGTPRFLAGDLGAVDAKSDPHEVDLGKSLEIIAPIFKASPEGLVLRKAQADNIGDQHFRYRQVKNGREVIGGEIVVHVRKGIIYAANGSARDDLDAPMSPMINASAAITTALDASKAEYHATLDDSVDLAIEASEVAPLVYKSVLKNPVVAGRRIRVARLRCSDSTCIRTPSSSRLGALAAPRPARSGFLTRSKLATEQAAI